MVTRSCYRVRAVARLGPLFAALCVLGGACQKPLDARIQAGDSAAVAGQWAAARDAWGEAVKLEPGSANAHAKLGVALWQLGQKDDAARAWAKAVELDPSMDLAREGLARLALELGDAGAALDFLAGVKEPRASLQLALAQALLARGDAMTALGHAQAVLAATPDDVDAAYLVGSAQIALRRFSDAQDTLEKLQRAHPNLPLGSYGLARLAAAQSRQTDALIHLTAAKATAGSSWKADLVAADPAFVFLAASPDFKALVGK